MYEKSIDHSHSAYNSVQGSFCSSPSTMAHDQLLEEHYPEKMRSAEGSGNAFSELFALDNKALREDLPPGSKPVKPVADVTEESARAWLQDFGSFCLFYSSWGVINSFGNLH